MRNDDLHSSDPRLKYKWKWARIAAQIPDDKIKRMRHFQCSYSRLGDWTLEAVQWSGEYEAQIRFMDNDIAEKAGFKTRLAAQIGAEKLLKTWIKEQSRIIGMIK